MLWLVFYNYGLNYSRKSGFVRFTRGGDAETEDKARKT